jgi:4-carboxymuconolactone decarboxylase
MMIGQTPRIPPLAVADFSAQQAELVGDWTHLNFSRVIVRHPELYKVFVPYIAQVIAGSTLPPRDREVLVVRTLALPGEVYEAHHHVQIALKAGMTEADIAAVASGADSLADWDKALVRAADELVQGQKLSDASWAALGTRYSDEQRMELVFLVGCYTVMAMLTQSFGIELESDPETDERLKAMRLYV